MAVAVASSDLVGCGSDNTPRADSGGDRCPAPTTDTVREQAARAAAVLRVTVREQALLSDGVTTTRGLVARVDDAIAGSAPERAAIWPGVDTPSGDELLSRETSLVVFVTPHERQTTIDGTTIVGYDISGPNGLLARVPDGLVRVCKAGQSSPADESVLDGIGS
ncbi:hypothetical protein [Plantactinospora sp. GCM10030261]|uniref:hypothetical protein n=1 Tax=Plantactinospora sp. GCM10030261 TaxID=3273420 RepID=UPI003618DA33